MAAGNGKSFLVLAVSIACWSLGQAHFVDFDLRVPEFDVPEADAYVCIARQLPPKPHKLFGIQPKAKQDVVHHILLYGCTEPFKEPANANETVAWRCDQQPVCKDSSNTIMYGWGRNAPDLVLPDGVGFSVGHGTSIRYVVAQVHYLDPKPKQDNSGVTLMLKPHAVPYAAGLIAFASMFTIPPGQKSYPVKNQCCYKGYQPLTMFGVRVHTHALGKTVFMEREKWDHSGTERLVERSPQLPQAFVPVPPHVIWPGDTLHVECIFNSSGKITATHSGPTHTHEMCNMYVMVYGTTPYIVMCDGGVINTRDDSPGALPLDAHLERDPTPFWKPPLGRPSSSNFGDATSVTIAPDGSLWVLYRGSRSWTDTLFGADNRITQAEPIPEACVAQLDPETGHVKRRWGANTFWMPHSITVDRNGDVWVTDVGRHQVLKFDASGKLLMEVGHKLQPGGDTRHFCKPTHVAVLRDLSFVVSDGYCNSRIVRFDAKGNYRGEGLGPLHVSHSLLVDECDNTVLVASRDDSKVLTFSLKDMRLTNTQDLSSHGLLWALRMGPHGLPLALLYDFGKPGRIVNLAMPNEVWELPGTEQLSPHDFAIGAAAVSLTGAGDRLFAVYIAPVGVACTQGCGPLLKYVLMPKGFVVPNKALLVPFTGVHNTTAVVASAPHLKSVANKTEFLLTHRQPGKQHQQRQGHKQQQDPSDDDKAAAQDSKADTVHPRNVDGDSSSSAKAKDADGQSRVEASSGDQASKFEAYADADTDTDAEVEAAEGEGDEGTAAAAQAEAEAEAEAEADADAEGQEEEEDEAEDTPLRAETFGVIREEHSQAASERSVTPSKVAGMLVAAVVLAGLVGYMAVAVMRKYVYGPKYSRVPNPGASSSPDQVATLEQILARAEAEVEAGMYIKSNKHRTPHKESPAVGSL